MPPWFRGFSSFRSRVFWSVVPIVVSFLVFQGWMNVREHRRRVTEEFEKRGRALTLDLGLASELGVFSEDKKLLETAMRGPLRNPDVAYVIIQGDSGKTLASGGRQVAKAGPVGEAVIEQTLSRHVERDGVRFIEFLSPVVSDQVQAPDEPLIGTPAGPRGESQRAKITEESGLASRWRASRRKSPAW